MSIVEGIKATEVGRGGLNGPSDKTIIPKVQTLTQSRKTQPWQTYTEQNLSAFYAGAKGAGAE